MAPPQSVWEGGSRTAAGTLLQVAKLPSDIKMYFLGSVFFVGTFLGWKIWFLFHFPTTLKYSLKTHIWWTLSKYLFFIFVTANYIQPSIFNPLWSFLHILDIWVTCFLIKDLSYSVIISLLRINPQPDGDRKFLPLGKVKLSAWIVGARLLESLWAQWDQRTGGYAVNFQGVRSYVLPIFSALYAVLTPQPPPLNMQVL